MNRSGPPLDDEPGSSRPESHAAHRSDRFAVYAEALASLIDDPDVELPLTLAIHAPWGAGKSLLARRVFERLHTRPAASGPFPHVGCWFNAWMHDEADSIATALVAHVAQTADRMRPWWRRFRSPLPVSLTPPGERSKHRLVVVMVTILLGILTSCGLLALFQAGAAARYLLKETLGWEVAPGEHPFAALGGGGLWSRRTELLFIASTLAIAVTRRFAEIGSGLGGFLRNPQAAAAAGSIDRVRHQLGEIVRQATPPGSRFVVFIDEIDLCRPPHCIDILETVSQLLDHPMIVTVVVADLAAVAAHAELKYEKLASKYVPGMNYRTRNRENAAVGYGAVYLEKFLQVKFLLPLGCDGAALAAMHPRTRVRRVTDDHVESRRRWLSVLGVIFRAVTQPLALAGRFHRKPAPGDGAERVTTPGDAGGALRTAEGFFDPLRAVWNLPPSPWMVPMLASFALLLPARLLAFLAARGAWPSALRAFPVCADRTIEARCMAAAMTGWTATVWTAALLRAAHRPLGTIWPVGAVGGGIALLLALFALLRQGDAHDRRVLSAIRRALREGGADPGPAPSHVLPRTWDLLRDERLRHGVTVHSAFLEDALEAAFQGLAPLPRLVKRVALALRLEVDVLLRLGLVGEGQRPTASELGKWTALRERWPTVGWAALTDKLLVGSLEDAARAGDPSTLASLLPDGVVADDDLRAFLVAPPYLGEAAEHLARITSAPPPSLASRSRGRPASPLLA
jgi:hypothetical protein